MGICSAPTSWESVKTVSSLTVDDLRAHMRRYYTPERMVAAVCGRFDLGRDRAAV